MPQKARDFQRSKVYEWERRLWKNEMYQNALPLHDCEDLAYELYGKRVKVKDGRGRRNACAFNRRYPTIALPKWARNRIVIAHEVAHLKHRSSDVPWHGAMFMREYIQLLAFQGIFSGPWLTADAKDFGLKVA